MIFLSVPVSLSVCTGNKLDSYAQKSNLGPMLIYFHPKVLAVMLLGFSSGLPRLLVASTLGALLTDHALSMAAVGLFAYVALPYSFNFLWAPFADHLKIPYLTNKLGKRRGWILFNQLALTACLGAIALIDPASETFALALLALLTAFFSASQDIGIDALRTEYLAPSQYGEGAAMAVFGYRLGMLAAGAGALYLAEFVDWSAAYIAMAALMLVGIATILAVKEPENESAAAAPPITDDRSPITPLIIAPFKDFMQRFSGWGWLLAFILFYRLSDGFIGFMTTPFFLEIGFEKSTIANIAKLYGFGATLLGMFVGGAIISKLGLFTALWSFALFQLLANLAYLHLALIGPQLYGLTLAISMDNLSGGMVTAAAIAFMMRLCQSPLHTATQYALLSSLASLGSITLAGSAGWIAQTHGWPAMFTLSALLGLPCLLIFYAKRQQFRTISQPSSTAEAG